MTEFGAAIAPSSLQKLSQTELVTLARQGQIEAIARLMNRSLDARGVTAELVLQDHCLYVVLESPLCPSEGLVAGLQRGMASLAVPQIEHMRVYGRSSGAELPAWSREVTLNLPSSEADHPSQANKQHSAVAHPPAIPQQQPQRHPSSPPASKALLAERYDVQALIHQDGAVRVYEAMDRETGLPTLVKTLSYRDVTHWQQVEQFEREGRLLAQLRHPGIPSTLSIASNDHHGDRILHLIQPNSGGTSCFQRVEAGWRTTEAGVRQIAMQTLAILQYLHTLRPQVIHCNVNPHTLMLHPAGSPTEASHGSDRVSLTGFAAAWDGGDPTFIPETGMESDYVAPEVMRGTPVPASDLYGLGTTVLFLLTHHSPLDLPHSEGRVNFAHLDLSPGFKSWLEKMTHPDASRRFPSAVAALVSLRQGGVFTFPQRMPAWKAIAGMTAVSLSIVPLYLSRFTVLDRLGLLEPFSQNVYQAAIAGDRDAIRTLLRHGQDATTLLYQAETATAVEHLIEQGAQVNGRHPKDGASPLHRAIHEGRVDAATALLQRGAEVDAPNQDGTTPLDDALHQALRKGGTVDRSAIALLMAHSATPRQTDLKAVIAGDRRDLVALLIADSDLESLNRHGRTILAEASARGSERIVESLIARGANVNSRDPAGQTPLHLAAAYGQQGIIKTLLAAGADLDAVSHNGFTPLHLAAARGQHETVRLLTAQGANVDAVSREGLTPLHFAAASGHRDIVQILLGKGANVTARDRQGKTATDWARANRHWNVLELLQLYGG